MIINKKIGRTIRQRSSQYIGSVVLILLACLLYTMFNIVLISLKSNTAAFRASNQQESAYFITQNSIRNIGNLEEKYNLILEERKSFDFQYSSNKVLRVFDETKKVDIPYIIKGRDIHSDSELIISQGFAQANKISLGDSLSINGSSFTVVGYADFPDYNYAVKEDSDLIADANTFGQAAISKSAMTAFTAAQSFYSIKFNSSNEDSFKSSLSDSNVIIKWNEAAQNTRISTTDVKMVSLASLGTAIPVFIMILSCLIIGIVMARLVKNESIQIGTMYAIGYTKNQIIGHYLSYPVIVGMVGSILGTALGAVLVKPMITFYLSYFNTPVQKIEFSLLYVLISLLAPTIILAISVFFVLRNALVHTAVELMRGDHRVVRLNLLERSINLSKFNFSTKFKIREMLRNIPRGLLLFIGIVFASSMLLFGFSIRDEVDQITGINLENTYKYSYQYIFNSMQLSPAQSGEAFSLTPFELKADSSERAVIYGVSTASKFINLTDSSGTVLSLDETIVSKSLADNLKLKVGDSIALVSLLTSKSYEVKIDAITTSNIGTAIYMPLDKFNAMLNYPTNSYLGLWSDTSLSLNQSAIASQMSIDDVKSAYNSLLAPLNYMVSIIAFFAFFIGLMIIYIVTSLVIEENKLNISLLKVLGYRKKRIYSLMLNSNTFIVVLGFLVAIPFMLTSIGALMKNALKTLNITMTASVSIVTALISFVIVLATYEFSKLLTRRKINHISMSETLKTRAE